MKKKYIVCIADVEYYRYHENSISQYLYITDDPDFDIKDYDAFGNLHHSSMAFYNPDIPHPHREDDISRVVKTYSIKNKRSKKTK